MNTPSSKGDSIAIDIADTEIIGNERRNGMETSRECRIDLAAVQDVMGGGVATARSPSVHTSYEVSQPHVSSLLPRTDDFDDAACAVRKLLYTTHRDVYSTVFSSRHVKRSQQQLQQVVRKVLEAAALLLVMINVFLHQSECMENGDDDGSDGHMKMEMLYRKSECVALVGWLHTVCSMVASESNKVYNMLSGCLSARFPNVSWPVGDVRSGPPSWLVGQLNMVPNEIARMRSLRTVGSMKELFEMVRGMECEVDLVKVGLWKVRHSWDRKSGKTVVGMGKLVDDVGDGEAVCKTVRKVACTRNVGNSCNKAALWKTVAMMIWAVLLSMLGAALIMFVL